MKKLVMLLMVLFLITPMESCVRSKKSCKQSHKRMKQMRKSGQIRM